MAGTPVIAFRTGGLKDTVFDFNETDKFTGNGFTFQKHCHGDFRYAIERAMAVFRNESQYELLRQNARESVLDLSLVAFAWYREFHRCVHCLVGIPPVVIACGANEGDEVAVVGAFTGNQPQALEKTEHEFRREFYLPDGRHEFRFVIDGEVKVLKSQPWKTGPSGDVHVVIVDTDVERLRSG